MILVNDPDFTLHVGDALETLRLMPAESVDMCVTSPPYWGLRDYSAEGQLGLEATPDLYVQNMVAVFREVRRVLKPHGSLWLNLGDSYAGGGGYSPGSPANQAGSKQSTNAGSVPGHSRGSRNEYGQRGAPSGLKPKDMVGIPWRVAFALQADGWYLRSDIIWSKPNPMPESVTDRPTKAHEYVFLLTKGPRYFFDQEAVREDSTSPPGSRAGYAGYSARAHAMGREPSGNEKPGAEAFNGNGRNVRSVWEIATHPYPEAHFATYPPELVRRCILAGSSERGVCPVCGKPWERDIERGESDYARMKAAGVDWQTMRDAAVEDGKGHDSNRAHIGGTRNENGKAFSYTAAERTMRGWLPTCDHDQNPVPATVLDPFLGSGTTALVAREQGRRCIGIELSREYAALAARRLGQLSLLAEPVLQTTEGKGSSDEQSALESSP